MQAQCVSSSISVIAGDLRTLLRKYASKVVSVATSLFACLDAQAHLVGKNRLCDLGVVFVGLATAVTVGTRL